MALPSLPIVIPEPNAEPARRLEPRRHHFAGLGALTLLGHVMLLGLASELGRSVAPLPLEPEGFGVEMLLVDPEAPVPKQGEDGGGSVERGSKDVASGTAKRPPPKRAIPAVAARNPEQRPPTQTSATAKQKPEQPTPSETAAEDVGDLFALDELLTSDSAVDSAPTRLKLAAARTTTVSSETVLAAMTGNQAAFSRFKGTGPGSGGGRGGAGKRSATPFGGTSGAFTGHVCFIPQYTPSLRSLGQCQSQLTLHTDVLNISPRNFKKGFPGLGSRDEWFAILYSGQFSVAETGKYTFRVISDDGSILRVDDKLVVDHDGLHGPSPKTGSIELSAGEHRFELRYFQGPRAYVALQLFVTPPGKPEQLFTKRF